MNIAKYIMQVNKLDQLVVTELLVSVGSFPPKSKLFSLKNGCDIYWWAIGVIMPHLARSYFRLTRYHSTLTRYWKIPLYFNVDIDIA